MVSAGDMLVDRVEKNALFTALRYQEGQATFDTQLRGAYYIQESTGLRLAVPGARFFDIQFNSRGFRGPELDDIHDGRTIRIAYLGSSVTLDKRAFPDEKSWPALTTQLLEKAFPGCKFTYQNTGITGMSSRQLVAYYKEMLTRFRPDIAVVMTDDRIVTLRELAQASGLSEGPAEKFSFTREQLLAHYGQDVPELLRTIRQHGAIPVLLGFGQKLQENQSAAEQAAIAMRGRAHMPFMSIENFLLSAKWYNEAIRDIAERFQVTHIEWHERVPGVGPYFYDFRHFSPAGSALVAEILVDEMRRSTLFAREISARFGCGVQGM
jgi:hypothetical protein